MKKPLFTVGLLLAATTLSTAAWGEPLRLTLPQAVKLAWADNPDIALSQHRQQSAAVSIEAARGLFLPSLQGSADASLNYLHQPAPGEPDDYRTANMQLTANLNLFNGFADTAGLAAARQQLQSADADLLRQEQTVAFSVATSFIAILADTELVQVQRQNLESQKALEEQISAFYKAGVRAVTDLYQQQAATAQAEFSLIDARRNLQVDKLSLLQAIGRTPPADVEALPPDTQALNAALQDIEPTQATSQALVLRPDLLSQEKQIAAARQQTKVAKAGYLPSLDLQAGGSTNYTSLAKGGLGSQFDDNRGAAIGLALSVPIFDRDQTRTNVAQARINESDASTTLLKLQQQVGVEVGQALADYQRARQQLVASTRQLDYACQALDASEARYRVGVSTWIELSNARTVFVQAQGDEVRARYDVLLQGLNIGYTRGDLENLLQLLSVKETQP